MTMIRASIRVSGRVQGVGYRQFTQTSARAHAVCGWVMNQPNGDVTAVIEGEENAVRNLITCCHQGPQHAEVKRLTMELEEYTGEYTGFAIRR